MKYPIEYRPYLFGLGAIYDNTGQRIIKVDNSEAAPNTMSELTRRANAYDRLVNFVKEVVDVIDNKHSIVAEAQEILAEL